ASAPTISAPTSRATSAAISDFPVAVGPTMKKTPRIKNSGDVRFTQRFVSRLKSRLRLTVRMFARFRAANHELAAEEFLIVQLLHRAFRFLDRLHLDERETFRALVVAIADDFGVLDM